MSQSLKEVKENAMKTFGEQHSEGKKKSTCKRVYLVVFEEYQRDQGICNRDRGKTGKEVRKVESSALLYANELCNE